MQFLAHYGYLVLMIWVFAEQLALPLPAAPVMLAAGALAREGPLHLGTAFLVAITGWLAGDLCWFYAGRRGGSRVLKFICRISLEPDSCVRRTSNAIEKYGPKSLLLAKFVPGINAVAAPLSGAGGVAWPKFLAYDLCGAVLWCGSFLAAGYVFHAELAAVTLWLGRFAWSLFVILLVVIPCGYSAFKYRQRRRFVRKLWTERVSPEDVLRQIEAGEALTIIDLRHPLDFLANPSLLPSAIRITPDQFEARYQEIPRDRDVILYCT
jgi:membrane protein DedA with SNARE-associated domain